MIITLHQKRLGVVIDRSTGLVVDLNSNQIANGSNLSYIRSFRDLDLTVANLLILPHNFGYRPKSCVVYDSIGNVIYPDNQGNLSVNSYFLEMTAYRPLLGNYEVILNG